MKTILTLIVMAILTSCNDDRTTQVGEGTFVHGNKVYKLVDNELTQIADLDSKDTSKPQRKAFGNISISYVKAGASADLNVLYRAGILYFKLNLKGINDLKDNYSYGEFTIQFSDEFGFILQTTPVQINELIGMVGEDNKIQGFEYNGKTPMTSTIYNAIKMFSVSSTVKAKK